MLGMECIARWSEVNILFLCTWQSLREYVLNVLSAHIDTHTNSNYNNITDVLINLIVVIIHNIYEYQIMTLFALNLHNMSIISPETWGEKQPHRPSKKSQKETRQYINLYLIDSAATGHQTPLFPGSVQKSESLSTAMDPEQFQIAGSSFNSHSQNIC